MSSENNVFEKTYNYYLSQIGRLSLDLLPDKLGAKIIDNHLAIFFFNNQYFVSHEEIVDTSGKRPFLDICVILSRYILMCPPVTPGESGWVNFRDLKNSGPLTDYFSNDVERAIARYFSRKTAGLKNAGAALGGYPPGLDVSYDIAVCFDALPKVPVLLLFNEEDDEFPAKSLVLFERRVEKYLDAECIAMLGRQLFYFLRKTDKQAK